MTIKEMQDSKKNFANEAIEKAHQFQKTYNNFVTIIDKPVNYNKSGLLSGIPYALKDNISTKGILTTASSNILKDYIPVYDATVYEKLKDSGAILIGKATMDELAMGGTGTTAHTGIVRNPWDKDRLIGGSSAGSTSSVALGVIPFAIGSDTGDSIRKPAAYGGVVGFKPTYGRVSRYGLFAFASSMDHIGCITRSVYDAALVTDVIKGYDEKDMTSLEDDGILYHENLNNDINGKKIFYIKELVNKNNYTNKETLEILDNFYEMIEKLEQQGAIVQEISIDQSLLEAIYPTYITISCAEATSNNANLTGILYGPRENGKTIDELMFNARTKGFSELIKRRFILGSYILQKENQEKLFLNASRVRRMIVDKINSLFNEYDFFIAPASGSIAPKFEDDMDKLSSQYLLLENHLAVANFGGFPSITIPTGFVNNMPIGINITGRVKEDLKVLNIASCLEDKLNYKDQIARGEK